MSSPCASQDGSASAPGSGAEQGSPEGPGAAELLDALWDEVVGQPGVVGELRAAGADPLQAYLLVGPVGSGKRAAATAFAAEVIAAPLDDDAARRAVRSVAAMAHPGVHLVQRVGASITVAEAREVVRMASRAPSEGANQVFILDELHLAREAAPTLLKAIEEPAPGVVFVILAEEVTEALVTVASRCVRHTFSPVPTDELRNRLVAEGVEVDVAVEAARSAGGSLHRARLLAGDAGLAERREAWHRVPERLDGTGVTASEVATDLLGSIDSVLEPLTAAHERELEAFEEMVEVTGDRSKGRRDAIEKRHKREERRHRSAELVSGASALLDGYRNAASDGSPERAGAFVAAASAVRGFTDAVHSNANERLALLALLLDLEAGDD